MGKTRPVSNFTFGPFVSVFTGFCFCIYENRRSFPPVIHISFPEGHMTVKETKPDKPEKLVEGSSAMASCRLR
jgi:hypothetical protein